MTVIRELIYKYGALRDPGLPHVRKEPELKGEVPLTSNKIVTLGEAFKNVHKHFRCFKLRNPRLTSNIQFRYHGRRDIVARTRTADREAHRIRRNFLKTGLRLNDNKIEEGRLIIIYRHRGGLVYNKAVDRALYRLNVRFLKSASLQRLTPEVHASLKMARI
ncbi:hypothetical protein ZHAS_00012671 [Anopheles sinensis]|uniref:Uncharacterized protein n=1 Tax=Anopheles sinensis TaxID=74873 RepID=A0A084W3G1_ANOSI|nr:hypothetical protein ZHAS_00012671 [Anopheles sinensis]